MLLSLCLLPVIFGQTFLSKSETSSPKSLSWGKEEILSLSDKCFCKLEGQIDDCSCQVNTVDDFNNKKIYARLKSLVAKTSLDTFSISQTKSVNSGTAQVANVPAVIVR